MSRLYFNGISIKFEPRDIWIGAYWESHTHPDYDERLDRIELWRSTTLYLCILPMLPIRIHISWLVKSEDAREFRKLYEF